MLDSLEWKTAQRIQGIVRSEKAEWAHTLAGDLFVCGVEGSVARSDTVPEAGVAVHRQYKKEYN